MPTTDTRAVFVLSMHTPYACGRTGVCCASGWDIPVTETERTTIARVLGQRRDETARRESPGDPSAAWIAEAPDLSSPCVAVLGRRPSGECVFLDQRDQARCLVQSAGGHDALPLACQQFPRVVLRDDRGVHVTLSHYCPTATHLLFERTDAPVTIVANPPGWHTQRLEPGLDARGQWPPLLRPGVLMSLDLWSAWEAFVVATLTRPGACPFDALAAIHAAAEALRRWNPARGTLDAHARASLRRPVVGATSQMPSLDAAREAFAQLAACVPSGRCRPGLPPDLERDWPAACRAIDAHRGPVGRYLAARAFASWMAYQAHGVRAHLQSLHLAAATLLVESARALAAGTGPRDAVLRAIQQTDLLLVHLADASRLADLANRVER